MTSDRSCACASAASSPASAAASNALISSWQAPVQLPRRDPTRCGFQITKRSLHRVTSRQRVDIGPTAACMIVLMVPDDPACPRGARTARLLREAGVDALLGETPVDRLSAAQIESRRLTPEPLAPAPMPARAAPLPPCPRARRPPESRRDGGARGRAQRREPRRAARHPRRSSRAARCARPPSNWCSRTAIRRRA